jgi:hypothetical protein
MSYLTEESSEREAQSFSTSSSIVKIDFFFFIRQPIILL